MAGDMEWHLSTDTQWMGESDLALRTPPVTCTLYRLVDHPTANASDFMSYLAMGKMPRSPEELREKGAFRFMGISMYRKMSAALSRQRSFERKGIVRHIARVDIPAGEGIYMIVDAGRTGHVEVFGLPQQLADHAEQSTH